MQLVAVLALLRICEKACPLLGVSQPGDLKRYGWFPKLLSSDFNNPLDNRCRNIIYNRERPITLSVIHT